MRRAPALLLACCLLLSGCGATFVTPAPEATPTPTPAETVATPGPTATPGNASPTSTPNARTTVPATPTAASQGYVTVDGGTLPVDATRVWIRTRMLLGTDSQPPDSVQVLNVSASATPRPSPFFRLWGLVPPNRTDGPTIAAYVTGPSRVYVNREIRDRPAFLEHTLAHEYAHIVQYRTGVFDALRVAYGSSPDEQATRTAVVEGTAVVVGDTYWRRYMTRGTRPAENIRRLYRNSTGAARWTVAPYRFGYRYASAQANASTLPRVYENPPNSTEEVLHPGRKDAVADLNTTVRETDTWLYVSGNEQMGELFVRVALSTELRESQAAAGADGWGADARVTFVNETGANGYAWVLRFDDGANATEFESVLNTYLRERGTTQDGNVRLTGDSAFRQERVDRRTVVVLAGAQTFVRNATVRATNESIRVHAPG